MNKQHFLAILAISFLLIGCKENHPISFYHWRTGFAPVGLDREFLQKTPQAKVYIKAFNLNWDPFNNTEKPTTVMKMKPDSLKFIDEVAFTLFVTDEAMRNIPEVQLPAMAARTAFLLNRTLKSFRKNTDVTIKELQIDCDWSLKSRDKYFSFLEFMRKEAAKIGFTELSATIRAHQVLNSKEFGIPPVDRGALMFYTMGTTANVGERISLFSDALDDTYLDALSEYPLHLDLVMPLSGWGVQYRDGNAIDLMPDLTPESLVATNCCAPLKGNLFVVDSAMYVNYNALNKGDEVYAAPFSESEVQASAEKLLDKLPDDARLILFHLENSLMEGVSTEALNKIAK